MNRTAFVFSTAAEANGPARTYLIEVWMEDGALIVWLRNLGQAESKKIGRIGFR